jgi:glycosyltransferase involved in cell wall biosynthesis
VRLPLSALLVVKDEEDRLPDALASVSFADEVVVVDTGSRDGTRELARAAGARVEEIPWEGFVAARNQALARVTHDWVLFLDADERVSPALRKEIEEVLEGPQASPGFSMPRLSYLGNRAIRHGTWYPDRKLRLGARSRGFRAEGARVHETLEVDGHPVRLHGPLIHHPYRDVSDALRKAFTYSRLSAEDHYERGVRGSAVALVARPPLEFFRCLVVKAGLLDGTAGLTIAAMHSFYYFLRTAFLLEMERSREKPPVPEVTP